MNSKDRLKKAFTLTEIMIVTVILLMIAAFVVPNFDQFIEQAKEKAAFNNLNVIRSGMQVYYTQNNQYPPGNLDLGAINSTLGINIIPGDGVYFCSFGAYPLTGQVTSLCQVFLNPWALEVFSIDGKVYCASGNSCPRCNGGGCPY